MVVITIYTTRKPICGGMENCIETDKGVLIAYPGTLINIISSKEVMIPDFIAKNAIPVYVEPLHRLCVDSYENRKAILICHSINKQTEICMCFAEKYWFAMVM